METVLSVLGFDIHYDLLLFDIVYNPLRLNDVRCQATLATFGDAPRSLLRRFVGSLLNIMSKAVKALSSQSTLRFTLHVWIHL